MWALGFKERLVYIFLVLGLIFFSLNTYASECSKFMSDNIPEINKREIGFKDTLYTGLPVLNEFISSDSSEDIINNITSFNNAPFIFKVNCTNKSEIFFSVYIGEDKVEFMDGVINLRENKYFNGPHSLINSKPKVVIIQADKQ